MEETKRKPKTKAKSEAPKKETKQEPEVRIVKKTVKPKMLNVRMAPEKGNNVMAVLKQGTIVEVMVTAQCPKGWSFIKADIGIGSVEGYIMTEYIK